MLHESYEQEQNPAINCVLALAFGKPISPINYILMHFNFRLSLVYSLTLKEKSEAEAIVPIPHAGVFLADCWSEIRSKPSEPLWLAFGYHQYFTSMFKISNDQEKRTQHAKTKVGSVIEKGSAKKVFLIDEAILSGATMKTAIDSLRNHGVEKFLIRTLLPPIIKECPYSVIDYIPGSGYDREWINKAGDYDIIAKTLGADGYFCLEIDDILPLTDLKPLCVECLYRKDQA